jgi:hypothetical protein
VFLLQTVNSSGFCYERLQERNTPNAPWWQAAGVFVTIVNIAAFFIWPAMDIAVH